MKKLRRYRRINKVMKGLLYGSLITLLAVSAFGIDVVAWAKADLKRMLAIILFFDMQVAWHIIYIGTVSVIRQDAADQLASGTHQLQEYETDRYKRSQH